MKWAVGPVTHWKFLFVNKQNLSVHVLSLQFKKKCSYVLFFINISQKK